MSESGNTGPSVKNQSGGCQEYDGGLSEGGKGFLKEPHGFVHRGEGTECRDLDVTEKEQRCQATGSDEQGQNPGRATSADQYVEPYHRGGCGFSQKEIAFSETFRGGGLVTRGESGMNDCIHGQAGRSQNP